MFDDRKLVGSNFTTKIMNLRQNNFDFKMTEYPIFDENYREILNKKILDHYNLYEIGFETAGLFRMQLNIKLNEIMPYYNELYKSQLIKINPLYTTDFQEEFKRNQTGKNDTSGNTKGNSTSNGNSNASGNSKHLMQDTPDSEMANLPIDQQTFATNLNLDESSTNSNNNSSTNSDSTSSSSSTINNVEDYIKTIKGNTGGTSQSQLLIDFRKTFLNIDMQIIDELKELFFGLWK